MRLDHARLVRPYANALLAISKTSADLKSWLQHLECLNEIIECPEVNGYLKAPIVSTSDKKAFLKEAWSKFSKNLPVDQMGQLVNLLVDNKRLFVLPELISALNVLHDQSQGLYKANVEGAFPLKEKDEAVIQSWLETQIGEKVYIDYRINPDLISGFKAQIGDKCIYASTDHLLLRLQETLKGS